MSDGQQSRRVLVITQFFPPETGAASHRVNAFVSRLAQHGHRVSVLTTFPNWPTGELHKEHRGKLRTVGVRPDGVRVFCVWSHTSERLNKGNKLANMVTSCLMFTVAVLSTRQKVDIVYVSSPPITLALPALVAAWKYRAKLVVDVRDVYPEVAARIGEWHEASLIYRMVGGLARFLYAKASLITCVTSACFEAIAKRAGGSAKIRLIPNGYDLITPALDAPFIRGPGDFVVSYTGNLGLAIGAGVIVQAALLLRDDRRFKFVLVGDGAEREAIGGFVRDHRLENVLLLGAQSREITFAVQSLSDVCVIPLRKAVTDSLPTKMMDAFALSRPIVVCADGEARRFVESANGGVAVAPEDPRALADALLELVKNPEALPRMGANGKAYVERHYNRAKLADLFCSEIGAVV